VKRSSIPNAICVLRIILIVPLVAALFAADYALALALIVIAGISDGIDGFLARHYGWRSRLGSLLDPAADKLLLVSTFLSLTVLGLVPAALTAIVICRDLLIVGGALSYRRLAGTLEGEPSWLSKLNTLCQLLFLVCAILHAGWGLPSAGWLTLLGAAVVFTSITSGLNYVLVWSRRARLVAGAG
jgi:cardiolipin synthase